MAAALPSDVTDLTECAICMGTLDTPKSLPCLHTYCLRCLQDHISTTAVTVTTGNKVPGFSCPECRVHTNPPDTVTPCSDWASKFPTNFHLNKLVESLSGSKDEAKRCEPCFLNGMEKNAELWCPTCDEHLCSVCTQYHRSMKLTRGHQLLKSEEARKHRGNNKVVMTTEEQKNIAMDTGPEDLTAPIQETAFSSLHTDIWQPPPSPVKTQGPPSVPTEDLINSKLAPQASRRDFGLCIAKYPFRAVLLYFEMEVLSTDADRIIAIGACEHDYPANNMVGWHKGSVGYHADNGKLYLESGQGTGNDVIFCAGDRVGCGIEGIDGPLRFQNDGTLFMQQTLRVYFTRNGQRVNSGQLLCPPTGLYPCVCLSSQMHSIKLGNFCPIKQLQDVRDGYDQWITPGHCHNLTFNQTGVLSYHDPVGRGDVGIFVSNKPITSDHNACTIRILDLGQHGMIALGIGPENYQRNRQPGWDVPSIGFHGDDGVIFHNRGSGTNPSCGRPSIWQVGNDVTVIVTGIDKRVGVVDGNVNVSFYLNDNLIHTTPFTYPYTSSGVPCVFMVGLHSSGEEVRLLNFLPQQSQGLRSRLMNTLLPSLSLSPSKPAENVPRRWIQQGHTFNVLVERSGVISYADSPQSRNEVGIFVSSSPITNDQNQCTIRILDMGQKGTIALGVGPENYPRDRQPGWTEPSIGFHGDDGLIYHNVGHGSVPSCGQHMTWKVGDEVRATVTNIQSTSGMIEQYGTVSFYLNNSLVHTAVLTYTLSPLVRCVFMVGLHSPRERVLLENFRLPSAPTVPITDKLTMDRCDRVTLHDDGTLNYLLAP